MQQDTWGYWLVGQWREAPGEKVGESNSQPTGSLVSVVVVIANCYSFSTGKMRNRVSDGSLQGQCEWNVSKGAIIQTHTKKATNKTSARLLSSSFDVMGAVSCVSSFISTDFDRIESANPYMGFCFNLCGKTVWRNTNFSVDLRLRADISASGFILKTISILVSFTHFEIT